MIVQRSDENKSKTTSQEDWEDAVKPTTEAEQASTESSQAAQNPFKQAWNWLDNNKDAVLALGVIASLSGNAYTMVKNR